MNQLLYTIQALVFFFKLEQGLCLQKGKGRLTMHMWVARTTTPTPEGSIASQTAFAISLVSRSWTCNVSFLRPAVFIVGPPEVFCCTSPRSSPAWRDQGLCLEEDSRWTRGPWTAPSDARTGCCHYKGYFVSQTSLTWTSQCPSRPPFHRLARRKLRSERNHWESTHFKRPSWNMICEVYVAFWITLTTSWTVSW